MFQQGLSHDKCALLADEINRNHTPTQSSLLESMEERQVTVDGKTISAPPFLRHGNTKIPSNLRELSHCLKRNSVVFS